MNTWIITGATRGLGHALAEHYVAAGDAVAFCARSEEDVRRINRELGARGLVLGMAGSIANRRFVERLVERASLLGELTGVVLNAAVLPNPPLMSVASLDVDDVRRVLDINLIGSLEVLQAAHPYLMRAPSPRVGVITSDASGARYPGWAAYGLAKAALELATLTYHAENPRIPVFVIDPGDMDTAMHRAALPDDGGELRHPNDVAAAIKALLDGADAGSGRWRLDKIGTGYVPREVQ